MIKIGFAITSSYCTVEEIFSQIIELTENGYDIIPIVSEGIILNDTRFGKGEHFKKQLEILSGKKVTSTIVEAERFGPTEPLDLLVVAPATGNYLAKLANGITDSTVTMATKATLRNERPIVIGISTNDGLGLNGENIMKLKNIKNIYFIPFGQDDFIKKPNSLIAHWDDLRETIEHALEGRQVQPILKGHEKVKKL